MSPAGSKTEVGPLLSTGAGPKGPTLIDEEGREVILKGLSVFGFNSVYAALACCNPFLDAPSKLQYTDGGIPRRWTMIGNMTGGSDATSRDIGQVIYRMKMLGFNAIRLPFTFAGLAEVRRPSASTG